MVTKALRVTRKGTGMFWDIRRISVAQRYRMSQNIPVPFRVLSGHPSQEGMAALTTRAQVRALSSGIVATTS